MDRIAETPTTLGALAAGVPLVVTPLFADQPQNGRRVAAVGAGVVIEPDDKGAIRSAVEASALHDAIATVLGDETFRRAAGAIAAEVRELPPVDEALDVLDTVLYAGGGPRTHVFAARPPGHGLV